jgi:hypothetical protein
MSSSHSSRLLLIIAIFKFIKAALLVATGIGRALAGFGLSGLPALMRLQFLVWNWLRCGF